MPGLVALAILLACAALASPVTAAQPSEPTPAAVDSSVNHSEPEAAGDKSQSSSTDSAQEKKEYRPEDAAASHDHNVQPANRTEDGFWAKLLRWLGKFHPVATHFPIALLMVALVSEALFLVGQKPEFRFTARFCLLLGTLGAILAAMLGWFLAGFQWTDATSVRTTHRWLGTGTAAWSVVVLLLSELCERRGSSGLRGGYRTLLLLGAVLVGITGFYGGAIVYGWDHYRWPASPANPRDTAGHESGTEQDNQSEPAAIVEMTDMMTFEPDTVTINAGDTVRWRGVGSYAHTVTADPQKAEDPDSVRLPEGAAVFDSGRVQPGETYSRRFEIPGRYRYFCIPHEAAGMIGEVRVYPPGDESDK